MQDSLEKKIFEVKITSKGQGVIPKTLRDKYNLKKGTRAKIIETKDGILIKPSLEGPWNGLRGMMKTEWKDQNLNQPIKEAEKSLFKFKETRHG